VVDKGTEAVRKIRGGAAAISLLLTFAFVASAQAAISSSNVTTPADGSLLVQNRDTNPSQTFTVSGTISGSTGDRFDIDCYSNGFVHQEYDGPSGTGIPLSSGTSFSVTTVPQSVFAGDSCLLLAVPHGTTPSPGTIYTGPRIGFSEFSMSTISSGANSGTAYDYYFDDATAAASSQSASIDDCGPYAYLVDGTNEMNTGPYLINCGGSFYNSPNALDTSAVNRSEIQIDGLNAYGSDSADNLFTNSDKLDGFPALTASLDSFDSSTGNAQTTESEPLVKCTPEPENLYAPTSSDCTAFASTGVAIKRVTSYSNSGRMATVTDTYSSTDGSAHSLDLEYETDLGNSTSGWELPGQSSFTTPSTGATGTAPSTAPGTVYGIYDAGSAPSPSNPVGALTFSTPYNSVNFYNTLWTGENSALFDYQRMVPAGGSMSIIWSYATGTSLAEVQGYAADALAALRPAVTITSPANGVTVTSSPVTVTGTAGGGSGVKSVTVNGVTATVSDGHWTAAVPLTQGPNTLTATMTTTDGSTATASVVVTYTPVATGQPTHAGQPPRVTLVSKRFNGKAVLVMLACAASGSSCRGTVTLRYTETVVRHHKKRKILLVIASKLYSIGAGHTATVNTGLNRTGKRLLKTRGRLATKGTVTVTQANGHTTTGATFKLTLKQPAKRK
jgi:hypothetical protein